MPVPKFTTQDRIETVFLMVLYDVVDAVEGDVSSEWLLDELVQLNGAFRVDAGPPMERRRWYESEKVAYYMLPFDEWRELPAFEKMSPPQYTAFKGVHRFLMRGVARRRGEVERFEQAIDDRWVPFVVVDGPEIPDGDIVRDEKSWHVCGHCGADADTYLDPVEVNSGRGVAGRATVMQCRHCDAIGYTEPPKTVVP